MIETAMSEVSDNFSRFVTNVFGGQKQVPESRRLAQKDDYIVVEQEKKIDQDIKPKTEKNEVPLLQKSQKKLVVPAAKPISPAAKQKERRTSSPNLEKVNQSPLESLMNID